MFVFFFFFFRFQAEEVRNSCWVVAHEDEIHILLAKRRRALFSEAPKLNGKKKKSPIMLCTSLDKQLAKWKKKKKKKQYLWMCVCVCVWTFLFSVKTDMKSCCAQPKMKKKKEKILISWPFIFCDGSFVQVPNEVLNVCFTDGLWRGSKALWDEKFPNANKKKRTWEKKKRLRNTKLACCYLEQKKKSLWVLNHLSPFHL